MSLNIFKWLFGNQQYNKISDWELVEKHIAGFTRIQGKEVVRYMDIYQKFNSLTNEYEIKHIIYRTNCIFDNL